VNAAPYVPANFASSNQNMRRRSPGVFVAAEKGLIAHGDFVAAASVTLEQHRQ